VRKILAAVLLLAMVLTICACGKEKEGNNAGTKNPLDGVFSVGYARENVTPNYTVSTTLGPSTGIMSYIYTTCVVMTDAEGDSVMLFQTDISAGWAFVMDSVRGKVSQETGIPVSNIASAGTHTHSAPQLLTTDDPAIGKFTTELEAAMLKCAKDAMADRKEVSQMTTGTITVPVNTLNFVRHYTTESGHVKGDNFGELVKSPYTGHTHDADNVMQIVRFERKEGKAVSLINWQTHPHRYYGTGGRDLTADLVGAMRDKYEKETGDLFAYYTGASGNINPKSRIEKENTTADFKEQGEALAVYAVRCLNENMTEAPVGKLGVQSKTFAGEVNHSEDGKLEGASAVYNHWKSTNNNNSATQMAEQYGIGSPYHAQAIINKSKLGKTLDMELSAFSIGDSVGIICAPYEMFDENGLFVKDHSPFRNTIVITLCNDCVCYISSEAGYEYGSYGAQTGKFVKGTGELLASTYVSMLEELYNR